jgi:hypothetical protein
MAANVLQAVAQGASAVLILTGRARVWELMALAAARGVGVGFYFPAAQGLLPQNVPADQLAKANALDRISRNSAQISGAAVGGVLVGLAGPGWGLAVDAVSFAAAAALRAGMRFAAIPSARTTGMFHEMREGWHEFIARRWLWAIVLEFAFIVAISAGTTSVLGPLVAVAHLGGARGWGIIMATYAAGVVVGGIVMIRFRLRRLLLTASLSVPVFALLPFALAVPLSVPLVAVAALLAGSSSAVFGVNWATTMQQEIPPGMLSRLSAYDALCSMALAPVGTAVAGPIAGIFGTSTVLATGGGLIVLLTAAVLLAPEVRNLRRNTDDPSVTVSQ